MALPIIYRIAALEYRGDDDERIERVEEVCAIRASRRSR